MSELLECGYFAQCEHDADHDGPHTTGMYPEWVVPTLEPMAFVAPASPSVALDRGDLDAIKKALTIGAISYDGDSWYAASNDGGAGMGYDECEAALKEGSAALDRLYARLTERTDR